MRKATVDDMELGNLMFGNSRGEFAVEPRNEYQEVFAKLLDTLNFDYHAHDDIGNGFVNKVFTIRPYYWGEDEAIAEMPNFVYAPTGLEISWYKYPMRDAYSNQNISIAEFKTIIESCIRSI